MIMDKEKLSEVFVYTAERARELSPEERQEIAEKFWAEWREDSDVLGVLEEVSDYVKKIIGIKSYTHNNAMKFHTVAMGTASRSFPFYDPDSGAKITTFLDLCIRGAIRDHMRTIARQKGISKEAGKALSAIPKIEQTLGEEFSFAKKAHLKHLEDMGFTPKTIKKSQTKIISLTNDSDNDSDYNYGYENPNEIPLTDALEKEQLLKMIYKKLDDFPEREKNMFLLHHEHGLNFRETGEVHGVSESRAYQLITKVEENITKKMRYDLGLSTPEEPKDKAELELSL